MTELVARTGPPTVRAAVFEDEPTTKTPTLVVDPEVGKVTASANAWVASGAMVKVPEVRMFSGIALEWFANLFPSKVMFPVAVPPESAPRLVSPVPIVLKMAPLLPWNRIVALEAVISALLMSIE